jgi:Ca-activated chloride channel family protein
LALGGNGNHTFAREADAAAAAVAKEIDGLLTKTVQAGSLLITPTHDVTTITVVNDLPSQSLPGGIMLELGDFYSGEQRKVLVTFEVPAMAALGLAQIASLALTYVSIPELITHTVTLPVSVNVVPQDIAQGRVPNPEVQKEKVLLETQAEKRRSEEALRRGDEASARGFMASSISRLESAMPDPEIDEEIRFLKRSIEQLDSLGSGYTSKRLRADSSKKARGYKTREQGGLIDDPGSGEESA